MKRAALQVSERLFHDSDTVADGQEALDLAGVQDER